MLQVPTLVPSANSISIRPWAKATLSMPHCLQSAGGSTLSMAVVWLPDNTRANISIMTHFTEGSFALYSGQQFIRYAAKWKKLECRFYYDSKYQWISLL
jgi:hypothetical protein